MKAIVLSCDRYHPFTEHMIASYQAIWPSHQFTFRIPYQQYPQQLNDKFGSGIELISTPADIKQTVLTLISDLQDDEWIYWCIDDKYLVDIDEDSASSCFEWVNKITDPSVCGVMFCRCRKLLDSANLYTKNTLSSPHGNQYIQRRNYYQIWVPQFMRIKVLRELFLGFPDRAFSAKEMDVFTRQEPGMIVKPFNKTDRMYVSSHNHACFGESTVGGQVTQNCQMSMRKYGISFEGFEVSHKEIIIGKI